MATEKSATALAFLRQNVLFAGLQPAVLAEIAEQVQALSAEVHSHIFRQGEPASGLYLLVRGRVQIFARHGSDQVVLSHADSGHLFGECLLCGSSMRSTTALALTDCELLFWPLPAFADLLARQPAELGTVADRLVKRLNWNQTMLALRLSHLFVGLPETVARDLIQQLRLKTLPANSPLLLHQEPAGSLCVVVSGQLQIRQHQPPHAVRLVGRGETVGAVDLVCQTPPTASISTVRDSNIAFLDRDTFESLLTRYPVEINRAFVKSIASHTAEPASLPKAAASFVLLNLAQKPDGEAFLQAFLASMQRQGKTRLLNAALVDQAFMRADSAQCDFDAEGNAALVQWLSEQEIVHRYIVYQADPGLTQWTRRCLRQADHILLLVDSQDAPEPTELEQRILAELPNQAVPKTLLIRHGFGVSIPQRTSAWLQPRQLIRHYHLKAGRQSDFDRVARLLTGNALGLVLSGGGARGFAHIGVMQALRELGIAVDMIGGNSMGAILAAQFALQWEEERMQEQTMRLCQRGDRPTLPLVSLFSGNTMADGLAKMFGQVQIEDLWLPFFCVSCNLSRASLTTHNRGDLLGALFASNSPPGIFPPQIQDGDLLVDGALLNNLPLDVMRELNPNCRLIAVDVNAREDLLGNTDHQGGVNGWQLLWRKLNPLAPAPQMPNLVQILARASMIGGLAQQKRLREGWADLYLQPPVGRFSLTGYGQAQAISEAGYRYALEQLAQWRQTATC